MKISLFETYYADVLLHAAYTSMLATINDAFVAFPATIFAPSAPEKADILLYEQTKIISRKKTKNRNAY